MTAIAACIIAEPRSINKSIVNFSNTTNQNQKTFHNSLQSQTLSNTGISSGRYPLHPHPQLNLHFRHFFKIGMIQRILCTDSLLRIELQQLIHQIHAVIRQISHSLFIKKPRFSPPTTSGAAGMSSRSLG